ncbi:response regulator [Paraclostridium bifermentans]|uniref:response regulator n=1 Tax=Paraclostridium bifermentans TaxID=1490 RepID=UPI0022E70EB8|nr:response regulator [Paraclostridium bifermentans]
MANLQKKYNLSPYSSSQLKMLLKHWKFGDIVYPGHVKSKLGLDMKQTYKLLEDLKDSGYLERNFEIYCSSCKKFKGKIVRTLNEIPSDCSCDFCDNEFNPFEDTIAIYKVIYHD